MSGYQSDEIHRKHEQWAILVGQPERLVEPGFLAEALGAARSAMREVRTHVLRIIDHLVADGYQFVDDRAPYAGPESGVEEALRDLWNEGAFVPVSLQAWLIEVGTVDLCGFNPNWPCPTYAHSQVDASSVVCTDPLAFDAPLEYITSRVDELKRQADEPLLLDIAPDHLHKANISGGPPYSVALDRPAVDSLLLFERHCVSFMAYVRRSLQWGGFAGMDYVKPNLLPIQCEPLPPI
ncbi:MAG: hypothetical protein H6839_07865 [Planctomycetes bacterium]|nr:hypothetical protein [Planctomycetota bacterium]